MGRRGQQLLLDQRHHIKVGVLNIEDMLAGVQNQQRRFLAQVIGDLGLQTLLPIWAEVQRIGQCRKETFGGFDPRHLDVGHPIWKIRHQ